MESVGRKEKLESVINLKDRDEKIAQLVVNSSDENYKLYYCDIRDKNKLEKIFEKENPEFVINLAGLAGVRPSLEKPLEYEEVNVRGTMNILEICKKLGIKKFIQASSSSVYGNNKKAPFKETDIVDYLHKNDFSKEHIIGKVSGDQLIGLSDIQVNQLASRQISILN